MMTWLHAQRGWRDLLWIALLGLAMQGFWAWRLQHPSYFDAYYYTTNAQRLAEGDGFTEEIIWVYLDAPDSLPAPSFTYWMPLPSLLGALGYKLGGTWRAAQLPFWLLAGLLPWLGYAISWQLTRSLTPRQRWRQARAAALFTMAGGYYAAYWAQPTTFVLFAWAGGGCLLALATATSPHLTRRQTAVAWFAAGFAAGLAHLTRADGILLVGVGALIWLWHYRFTIDDLRLPITGRRLPITDYRLRAFTLTLFISGYLLVMGGWFWRTYQLIGQPMSTVGTQTVFLTSYNDLFAYGRSFDLSSYLAWGWGNILTSKLAASWLALQTFIAVTGLTVFTFFLVWSWLRLGRGGETGRWLRPFTLYTLVLYLVMALVFTFPGQRGSLLHSSTAIWPWAMALAVAGVDMAVDWAAARRTSWRPEQAKRLFTAVFVLMVYVVTLAVAGGQPLAAVEAAVYTEVAAVLPAAAVVMVGTAPDFYYHTGLRAVAVPNEPPDVLLTIARRYGVSYLLLDAERPPVLNDLYSGAGQYPQLEQVQTFAAGFVLYRFVLE